MSEPEQDVPIDPRGSGRLVYDKTAQAIRREFAPAPQPIGCETCTVTVKPDGSLEHEAQCTIEMYREELGRLRAQLAEAEERAKGAEYNEGLVRAEEEQATQEANRLRAQLERERDERLAQVLYTRQERDDVSRLHAAAEARVTAAEGALEEAMPFVHLGHARHVGSSWTTCETPRCTRLRAVLAARGRPGEPGRASSPREGA